MSFTPPSPAVFTVENDAKPPLLRANPTVAQMRQYAEETAKKPKAMACLQNGVSDVIFTCIMACDSPKQAWDKLKKEFMGSEKTRQQQLINLRRDFENLKMKDAESIKQYADRIMATVNNIRLLGVDFAESRAVEKVITTLPERFESKISSLDDSSDLTTISLSELVNSLYDLEQRRVNRQEEHSEGAFQVRAKESSSKEIVGEDQVFNAGNTSNMVMLRKFVGAKAKHQYSNKISGCSHHMAADVNLFKELDRSFSSRIRIGNGSLIEAKGRGDMLISSSLGNKLITDVLYVPDIDQNLLSEVVIVPMADKCFMLDISQIERRAYLSQSDSVGLWHKRLGHVNFRSLDLLHKLGLAEDMTKVQPLEGVCDVYQLGKQARLPFPVDQACRAREKLELKSDVFEAFGKFKAMIENQAGCRIKILGTDNGVEYLSDRFKRLCEQARIHLQLTTVYTPQQNRAEAINSSVYLLNRLPTHAVKDKTPFEAWHGLKPSVSHLKVFGCVCYVLVPAERSTKLEKSSDKKGYRVYDPSTMKILVSRDIRFDEKKIWNWNGLNASQFEEDSTEGNLELVESEPSNGNVDDLPMRGTRSIADVYQRCNVAITWDLVERPEKKVIGVRWVFRAKFNADGSLNKHKAILVVKGYSQQYGVDFEETFAPVARLDTIKLLFALAAQKKWQIHQLDVKSAFLNVQGQEDKVYKLKKALYGLKQAPRAWYDRVDAYLSKLGFEKSLSEPTLYVKKSKDETLLIVSIYVDDLLVTGSNVILVNEFKAQMQEVFDMIDLGVMTYFLGMEVNQTDRGIFISQHAFILKILNKFSMQNCKPVRHQWLKERSCQALVIMAAKRVLRYIKGTLRLGMLFKKEKDLKLVGYSDSDWAGCIDDMKSTSGYFFTLSSSVFCWCSKKQQTVAQSTAEVEYIAAAAVNQAI
ncbi:hypothetical protein CXB51_016389 [Gossypium anomalum]|uniref:Integrase catalytic domain-containing protein n=1 Tax=Gossypium anomalum TaxID=47600 RepID=A0A8J6CUX8_9ROSI|nr:hypothetical protein CXB51_016389 [Gossypium anomalum]